MITAEANNNTITIEANNNKMEQEWLLASVYYQAWTLQCGRISTGICKY